MPVRPNSPCRHYGCKALVSPAGYCDAHKRERTGWFKTTTKTSTERGYGHAWTKLRRSIMLRDSGLCQVCHEANRIKAATEVDHIVPKSAGGTDSPQNLQAICKECHQLKTHREARGR